MFSSRTGGRRKYFHRFQCRHHACSQHRRLIAVHLLGCLCWYGEISLLFTAPGNLKDTEAASRWQPHCVFLQTSSVFCLLGDVDGWRRRVCRWCDAARDDILSFCAKSNAQIREKMMWHAHMRFTCSCISSGITFGNHVQDVCPRAHTFRRHLIVMIMQLVLLSWTTSRGHLVTQTGSLRIVIHTTECPHKDRSTGDGSDCTM